MKPSRNTSRRWQFNPTWPPRATTWAKPCFKKEISTGRWPASSKPPVLAPDAQARWCNLGKDFLQQKDWDGAIACYRQAIKINPRSAEACANLGVASYQKGQTQEAIDYWQRALEINPDQVSVENNLAWSLATAPDASLRNGAKAVALARQAGQSKGDGDAVILRTLAAACAETGQFPEAIRTVRRALQLAAEQKNDALASALQKELELYLMGKPLRETEPVK